ncbi:MAG TPA: iron-sulfur cluster insertion protein ErpA [Limnochordia bacterium]|nr:iron-sulfur cluster insertion protein ErpA [Limnochordia bacterium]
MTPSVTLTELAAVKIKEMMTEHDAANLALRVFVKGGGCSGLSYGMALDEAQEGDLKTLSHGVNILVDAGSLRFINGAVIDFKEGFEGGGFAIDNPNAIRTCGCGGSFHTSDDEGEGGESCC